jgi:hypothetical protein
VNINIIERVLISVMPTFTSSTRRTMLSEDWAGRSDEAREMKHKEKDVLRSINSLIDDRHSSVA